MAFLNTLTRVAGAANIVSDILGSVLQDRISIVEPERRSEVIINVVKSEKINEEGVEITDKPVENSGAGVNAPVLDNVIRKPIELTLECVFSDRISDLLQDPVGFASNYVASAFPAVAALFNNTQELLEETGLLDRTSYIDRSISLLRMWRDAAKPVNIVGLRLDLAYYEDNYNSRFLIRSLTPEYNVDTGDVVGVSLAVKEVRFPNFDRGGAVLQRSLDFVDVSLPIP